MRRVCFAGIAAIVCGQGLGLAPLALAGDGDSGVVARHGAAAPVARLIIGLRPEAGTARAPAGDRIQALAARNRLDLRGQRAIGPTLRVVELGQPLTAAELADALARLQADPAVAFAEPDGRARHHSLPNDPLFPGQWQLQAVQPAAIDAQSAWDVTTGSPGIVVAVLDTGVRFDHPDLGRIGGGGRLLPGHDFVGRDYDGQFRVANDGDGWDPDPSDPGDWVTDADAGLPLFSGCEVGGSSWHGTRVAGLIGARTNNGAGIAGATWDGWVLPVRVLGKCGGSNADIMQAMRWAAGLHVEGVPDNPYPARILNLSLGGEGSCSAGFQAVIGELAGLGVVVVASAGNAGAAVESPANCPGVVAVAGLRHAGTKVGYSNLGTEVTLAAPAGNCVNRYLPCLYSLDTTVDQGTTTPVGPDYTSQMNPSVGTSFSAPQVSALAALMLGLNGSLGPAQVIARLQASARAFPAPAAGIPLCHVPAGAGDIQNTECGCTASTCGAGMLSAPAALAGALRPIAAAVARPAAASPGQNVTLDASASTAADHRVIASYSWTTAGGTPVISNADAAVAALQAPAGGAVTVRLTVTDDRGASDSTEVVVAVVAASGNSGGGGGGGGALDWVTLAIPGVAVLRRQGMPRAARALRTSRCRVAPRAPGGCRGSG